MPADNRALETFETALGASRLALLYALAARPAAVRFGRRPIGPFRRGMLLGNLFGAMESFAFRRLDAPNQIEAFGAAAEVARPPAAALIILARN